MFAYRLQKSRDTRREERRVQLRSEARAAWERSEPVGGTQATQQRCASRFSESVPVIGVFALQGCVTPHRFHIEALGGQYKEIRTKEELESIHGLILPGGESTTMLKLIREFELEEPLRAAFQRMPVWGICAGSILMAKTVESPAQHSFGILDITIQRNAYGSQMNSFNHTIQGSAVSFIRAPIITSVGAGVQVKEQVQNKPVWVQQNYYMATVFHPELAHEFPSEMHRYFIGLVKEKSVDNIAKNM